MLIEYLHASKFGDGARVAEEFRRRMAERGATVNVHHVKDVRPAAMPAADLYVFSSPGRLGRPIRGMRRFLERVELPKGTRYAILTTEMAAIDKTTGQPLESERQRVRPIMRELLQAKGLVEVAVDRILVTGPKGPLADGWQEQVGAFADRIG
ncbi:MAG TPA: hypothetical protein VJP05_06820 [Acidimicrobiia bacterium]|nr:hypothetical protein [Acidimicrobiia bacterium]